MAGAGRRVFQPGEVLTASNVMSYLQDQAVMVFDSSAARGSAIGTATVSEGMTTYLKDSDALEFYNGSSWVGFAAAGGTALATVQDNLGVGLVRQVPPTVNFSGGTATANALGTIAYTAVTSLSLNGVFSTFRNYRIIISGSSSAGGAMQFRFRSGGTDYTGTVHSREVLFATGATVTAARGTGETNWELLPLTGTHYLVMDLSNPNSASDKSYYCSFVRDSAANINSGFEAGLCATSSLYDSFTIYPTTGNITGRIAVYGYND